MRQRHAICKRRVFNVRPRPGPLPPERVKRSTVASAGERAQIAVRFGSISRDAAKTGATFVLSKNARCSSLSSGERVRVRVSVITN